MLTTFNMKKTTAASDDESDGGNAGSQVEIHNPVLLSLLQNKASALISIEHSNKFSIH